MLLAIITNGWLSDLFQWQATFNAWKGIGGVWGDFSSKHLFGRAWAVPADSWEGAEQESVHRLQNGKCAAWSEWHAWVVSHQKLQGQGNYKNTEDHKSYQVILLIQNIVPNISLVLSEGENVVGAKFNTASCIINHMERLLPSIQEDINNHITIHVR